MTSAIVRHLTRHRVLWLCAVTFLVRAAYIFLQYDYHFFLDIGGDQGFYWARAMEFYDGKIFSKTQWNWQAASFHLLLGTIFRLFDWFLPKSAWLEAVILIQIALGAASVYMIERIARRITSPAAAFAAAAAWAFTYTWFFLNACTMSENFAVPLFIAAGLVLLSANNGGLWRVVVCGILFSAAVVMRPTMVTHAAVFVAYLFFAPAKSGASRAVWRVVAFLIPLALFLAAAAGYNNFISRGEINGLGANGGQVFFMSKCKVRTLITDGFAMNNDSYVGKPWPTVRVHGPLYDQDHLYRLGMGCIENDPIEAFRASLGEVTYLLFDPVDVDFPDVPGFRALMDGFDRVFQIVVIPVFFMAPFILFGRAAKMRKNSDAIFLWSLLFMTAATAFFMAGNRRYILPVTHVSYILFFYFLDLLCHSAKRFLKTERKWPLLLAAAAALTLVFPLNPTSGSRADFESFSRTFLPETWRRKPPQAVAPLRGAGGPGGLVARWSFEKEPAADVVSPVDGKVFGARPFRGKIGEGLRFDGRDDFADLGRLGYDFASGFTAAFWVYPMSIKNYSRFFDFSDGPGMNQIFFGMAYHRNDLQLSVNGIQVNAPNGPLGLNEWQHFAVTCSADGMAKIYKNGTLIAEGYTGAPKPSDRDHHYLGRSASDSDNFFNGVLDELYVFDRSLSPEEILKLSDSPPAISK